MGGWVCVCLRVRSHVCVRMMMTGGWDSSRDHPPTNTQRLGGPVFHAVSEEEGGGVLLSCRVVAEDIYQRQVQAGPATHD